MESNYLKQRRAMKLQGKTSTSEKKAEAKIKGVYFANQVAQAPKHCENCGAPLAGTKSINPSAIVAHILPKSKKTGCPSVALHPLNKFYACGDCHTDYDNARAKDVQNMPIFPVLVERVAAFYDDIAPEERRRVPAHFRPKDK
jgi:hypothetical protein